MSSPIASTQPKVVHQAAWVIGCRVVGIISTLASNMLVARLLGPEGFGVFLLVTSVLAFGCLLALSGLSEAGLRFVAENLGLKRDDRARNYLVTSLAWACWSSLTATGLVIVLLIFFQQWTQNAAITPVAIALVGLGVMVLAWQQLVAQLLRGLNFLRSASFYSGGQTGGPLSNLFFVIPLAFLWLYFIPISTNQVIGLLVGSICVTLPMAIWELSRAGRFLFPSINPASNASMHSSHFQSLTKPDKREFATVAVSFLGIQLLAFVATQSDIWIGSWVLSPEQFGLYGAAKRGQLIAIMPLQMALMTIQGTIPRLHAQNLRSDLETRYRSAITWAAIPAIGSLIVFMLFPIPVLNIVCGDAFDGAAPLVMPLSIGLIALIFFGSPADILSMTGNHRIVLLINALSALALIILGIIGASYAGPIGLAMGSSMVYALQNLTLWWIAKRCLGIWTHAGVMNSPGIRSGIARLISIVTVFIRRPGKNRNEK